MTRTRRRLLLAVIVFAALAAAPLVSDGYTLSLLARGMIFALAAVSLDFILGYGAMVSFGHAAVMGIGAYAVAILQEHGVREAHIAWPAAMGAAGLFAFVTGAVSLKTRGVYFIMITLAFGQMAYFVVQSLAAYGGDDGLALAARSTIAGQRLLRDAVTFHYVVLGLLALSTAFLALLAASPFGRVIAGAKENERRVRALGLNPYPYRLLAFTLAGAFGGLSGALLANLTEFVSPSFLSWHRSGELIVMVVAGGMGSLVGPILGGIGIVMLEEGLGHLTEHWRIIFGPLLVIIALYTRGGVAGLLGGRKDG